MGKLAIIARPRRGQKAPYLLLGSDGKLDKFSFEKGRAIAMTIDKSTKYCVGWYDIETHTNHLCESGSTVNTKYETCYACRTKTDFNPAFYHASDISAKQARYNAAPHSVYVAYFGNSLAKAGIMSDSRGLERLYEQGALLYSIVATCPDAMAAHDLESELIHRGLRNSVTKKQKAEVFSRPIDIGGEHAVFEKMLSDVGYGGNTIASNLDLFFFGKYPGVEIDELGDPSFVSGHVVGVVGRYLILENDGWLYGYWLSNMCGYRIDFGSKVEPIRRKPQQMSLL